MTVPFKIDDCKPLVPKKQKVQPPADEAEEPHARIVIPHAWYDDEGFVKAEHREAVAEMRKRAVQALHKAKSAPKSTG